MKTIQVYDKPMCCSTGVCGPSVDPVLPRFATDLDWVKSQGHQVERYNLSLQPMEFVQNPLVQQTLEKEGADCLPLIIVNGQIVSQRGYPSRELLTMWLATGATTEMFPVVEGDGGCCSGTSGCC